MAMELGVLLNGSAGILNISACSKAWASILHRNLNEPQAGDPLGVSYVLILLRVVSIEKRYIDEFVSSNSMKCLETYVRLENRWFRKFGIHIGGLHGTRHFRSFFQRK